MNVCPASRGWVVIVPVMVMVAVIIEHVIVNLAGEVSFLLYLRLLVICICLMIDSHIMNNSMVLFSSSKPALKIVRRIDNLRVDNEHFLLPKTHSSGCGKLFPQR